MVTMGQLVAGRYRVVRPLAAGGMSKVWLARDESTGEPVAIKRCDLPGGLTPDEQDLFRVWTVREARAFAIVGHPNVVRILDVLPDDDAPWIVMEYVPSRSLQQVIDESGALPPARVAGIGLAVLEGLLAIRRAGLLHLDVKPGNVLIADDGRVVLGDFGPAVTAEGVRALAGVGIILGSPKYLAPERLTDGVATPESDLWSLGATLYHAVEGRPPYVRTTTVGMLQALADDPPDPPSQAGPLTPILDSLLRRDPGARPAPDALAAELRTLVGQPVPVQELQAGAAERPRRRIGPAARRRIAVLATLLSVLGALVTVIVLARPESSRQPAPADSPPAAAQHPIPVLEASAPPPDGFVWFDQPTMYRVAVPATWKRRAGGNNGLVATGPAGQVMRITVRPTPPDALSALIAEERDTELRDYRRLQLVRVPDSSDAIWEYLFTDPKAGPMRAQQRVITGGSMSYTIGWRTPRASWTANVPTMTTVAESFTPKAAR